jgi:hypothetical protein
MPAVTVDDACTRISLILVPEDPALITVTSVPEPFVFALAVDNAPTPSLGDDANCGVAAIFISLFKVLPQKQIVRGGS